MNRNFTRRSFLKTTGAVAAGMAGAGPALAARGKHTTGIVKHNLSAALVSAADIPTGVPTIAKDGVRQRCPPQILRCRRLIRNKMAA